MRLWPRGTDTPRILGGQKPGRDSFRSPCQMMLKKKKKKGLLCRLSLSLFLFKCGEATRWMGRLASSLTVRRRRKRVVRQRLPWSRGDPSYLERKWACSRAALRTVWFSTTVFARCACVRATDSSLARLAAILRQKSRRHMMGASKTATKAAMAMTCHTLNRTRR
jgi:hypothetical protein